MVREATITQEQVNAAADALRAAGTRPTVRAVRERLGSGSNATVMRLLEVWKAGQVHQPDAPIALPPALQRALVEFIGQAVAEGKLALEAELVDMQQANTDLVAESERQAGTIDAQQAEAERVQSERDALAGRLEQMEKDLAMARDEAEQERTAAEAARTALAKAELRLEAMPRLEADLATVRADLDRERAGRVKAEQEAAVAAARLEGEIKARERLEVEQRDLAKREATASQRAAELGDALATDRAGRSTAEGKLDSATTLAAELRTTTDQLRRQLEGCQAEAAALRGKLEAALQPKAPSQKEK